VGVRPQVAKSLFRFDAASGLLSSQLGRHSTPLEEAAAPRLEPSLIAQAQTLSTAATEAMPLAEVSRELERLVLQPGVAAQPDLVASLSSAQAALDRAEAPFAQRETEARVREQVVGALAEFVSTASDPIGLDAAPVSSRMPLMSLTPAAPVQQTGLEGDDEMREIFLEEAREVLDTARTALVALSDSPGDGEQLAAVRRSFHPFKGLPRLGGGGATETATGCRARPARRCPPVPWTRPALRSSPQPRTQPTAPRRSFATSRTGTAPT